MDKAFATSTAAAFSPFLYPNSAFTMEKLATFIELTSVTSPNLEISCSIGFETVLAATCAVAPGTLVMTITCGGFASGKRFLGSSTKATIPMIKNPAIKAYNRYGLL